MNEELYVDNIASKSDKESAKRFISVCIEIKDMNDDEAMFTKVEEAIRKGIKGMQSAAASVMLHCLKPYTFPIINSAVNDVIPLFQIEGVSLVKPKELKYYIQNSRELKKFRDEKCAFKNYRAMDMKLSIYGRSKDIEDDESHTGNEADEDVNCLGLYSKEDFLNEVFISEQQYNEIAALLNRKKNIILQGAPGVGKTFAAKRLAYSLMGVMDDSRIEMVQFHQNYSYEDFIMGFRPVEGGGFELRNGVFYQFCIKAANYPNRDYYFIIDEINRGSISKIFGELLMLIENDKRGSKFAIPLTYKADSRFYVPKNVFIIGMMNTADRSLVMMDYALRRRFCFVEIEPAFNTQSFKKHLVDSGINMDLEDLIRNMCLHLMNFL